MRLALFILLFKNILTSNSTNYKR